MVAKQFTWNANDYANNSEAQKKWAMELLALLKLNGNESVLDIGCGDGKITAEIAHTVPEGIVVGIDSSSEMISLAKNKFKTDYFPNLTFEVMDARNISFENQFDVVFSNAALHWIKEQDQVLNGIVKALKANGKILLQMGGKGNAKDILDCFNELMLMSNWEKYFTDFNFSYSFLSAEEYRDLLNSVGLVERNVALIPKDMKQKGREGLAGWIRATWLPYLEKIPDEELRGKFISEIIDQYVKNFPIDNEGIIHVKMVRLQVEAFKP
jgi:trans-aconitate 2-methyltransferase